MTKRIMAAMLSAAALIPSVAQAQDRDWRARGTQAEQRRDVRDARQDYRRDAREAQQDYRRDRGTPGAGREYRQDIAQARREYRDEVRDARQDRARAVQGVRGDPRGWDRSGAQWRDGYRGDARFDDRRAWNRDWRRDGRYDWNRYRAQNRQAYRLPRYYGPANRYGGGYRRFGVGYTIGAPFFGRNYWIADPYAYRLPPAYGQYRWVRYYDDALLVDLRSGQVVDATYDIFWR